jgi:hypothetical protein
MLSMSKRLVNRQLAPSENNSGETVSGWDEAIRDARDRIKRMKQSIQTFERMRDEGEPWRGEQADQLAGPVRS